MLLDYQQRAYCLARTAAKALDHHVSAETEIYRTAVSTLYEFCSLLEQGSLPDDELYHYLDSSLSLLVQRSGVANATTIAVSLLQLLDEEFEVEDWPKYVQEFLHRAGSSNRTSIDALCIAQMLVGESYWNLVTKGDQPPSNTIVDLEYVQGVVEAVPIKRSRAKTSDESRGVRAELINIQITECLRLLEFISDIQTGQAEDIRSVIGSYRDLLEARHFLRADAIFRTIERENTSVAWFELEESQLESIRETHTALRGLHPEYADYVQAYTIGREQEKSLQGRKPLSVGVVKTAPGDDLLADSVRTIVRDVESQRDRKKVAWDSFKIAEKLDWVLKKIPDAAKAGRSVDELRDLVWKWINEW